MKEVIGTAIKCIFIVSVPCWLALAMDYANYKSGGKHSVAIVDWNGVQSFTSQNAMFIQTWIGNGDNLLTLLGTLAGLLMSGGFWTWRKAAAFQKGFETGWRRKTDQISPIFCEAEDKGLYLEKANQDLSDLQERYSKIAAELIEVKEAKEAYEKQIDDLNKSNTNASIIYDDQQQRIAHLSKDRDAWKAECINKIARHDELNTRIKQAEENHLQSYGPAKEAGKEEGRQELAAKIVEHLLASEQVFYALNQRTGVVTLIRKNPSVMLPQVLSDLIIALSGCMTPKKPQLNAINPTAVLRFDAGVPIVVDDNFKTYADGMLPQKEITQPTDKKESGLCLYCKKEPVNPGYTLEYKGLCVSCGNEHGMELITSIPKITNCNWTEWQHFLDMPIGEFIDKFGPLKTKEGMPLLSKREDGKISWRTDYTVREYIQTYGMFKKG